MLVEKAANKRALTKHIQNLLPFILPKHWIVLEILKSEFDEINQTQNKGLFLVFIL